MNKKNQTPANKKDKVIVFNKDAGRSYFLLEKIEAGLELKGTEVKSIKEGKVSIKESYAFIKENEAFIKNMHIKPYEHATIFNHEPLRTRRLLLHRHEIEKLASKIREKGLTLIITKLYVNQRGKIKIELAVAKGKTFKDRRDDIKAREASRSISAALKRKL